MERVIVVFSIGMPEVIMILVIALVVFGPGKLPEVGKAIGKGMNEFRRATSLELNDESKAESVKAEVKAEPLKADTTVAAGTVPLKTEEKK